jgi:hypothetical protein
MSIKASQLEDEISQTKQDTQSIRVKMEGKGVDIPARAGAMGMVSRDKTIVLHLDSQQTTQQQSNVEGQHAAEAE